MGSIWPLAITNDLEFHILQTIWATRLIFKAWKAMASINVYWVVSHVAKCRNPSLGLTTKVKGLQGCGPKGSPRVTSHTPGSVRKCEGVKPHTPKATPTLGDGVPMESQNFREQFQGSKLNGL
jgi:hypothetical protein